MALIRGNSRDCMDAPTVSALELVGSGTFMRSRVGRLGTGDVEYRAVVPFLNSECAELGNNRRRDR